MTEALILAADLIAGALLGTFFFGGLWWTVRSTSPSQWSGLLFGGSFLLRTAVAVSGFYLISHGNWQKLLPCLAGFLIARIAVTRIIRMPDGQNTPVLQGGGR